MQTIFKCDVKQWYNGVTSLVAGDGVRVVVWRFLADVCNLVETLLWFTRIHRQCPHRKACILIRRHLVHCRLPLLLNHRPFMTWYIYFCICKRINCKIHFSDWLSKSAKLFLLIVTDSCFGKNHNSLIPISQMLFRLMVKMANFWTILLTRGCGILKNWLGCIGRP